MVDPLISLWAKWDHDVAGVEDEEWREAVASPREVAISSRLRLVQFKILHRSYMSRSRLAKIQGSTEAECPKQCQLEGTFIHSIWECPHIQVYLGQVVGLMESVVGKRIECNIKLVILNIWGPTDLGSKERTWLALGFMVAKQNIARLWDVRASPSLEVWCKYMDWSMVIETSIYVSRGCPNKWTYIWGPRNTHRGNICEPPSLVVEEMDQI